MLEDGQCTDGELYVHGWTFQRIIAAVKKKRDDTDLLEYHIYDSPHPTLKFEDRMPEFGVGSISFPTYCQSWTIIGNNIKIVKSFTANDQAEFDLLESQFIGDNYEGMMARNKASVYKYKPRSYDLQKVKRFYNFRNTISFASAWRSPDKCYLTSVCSL